MPEVKPRFFIRPLLYTTAIAVVILALAAFHIWSELKELSTVVMMLPIS